MPIHNPRTGEIEYAQIFVAVLGASGYTFVHATHSQKQEDFIYSHVMCYNFFGGVPRVVVPDNLKSDLIKKMGAYFSTFSYNSPNNNQLNLASNFYSVHDAN